MTVEELMDAIRNAVDTAEDVGEAKSNIFDTLPKVRAYADEKDAVIAERDAAISERDASIAELSGRVTDLEEKRARLLEEKGTYIDDILKKKNDKEVKEEREEVTFKDFIR